MDAPVAIDMGVPPGRDKGGLVWATDLMAIDWHHMPWTRRIANPERFQCDLFDVDRTQTAPRPRTPKVKRVPKYHGNRIKLPSADLISLTDHSLNRHIADFTVYWRGSGNIPPQRIQTGTDRLARIRV